MAFLAVQFREQPVEAVCIDATGQSPVHHCRRRDRTQSKTIDSVERHRAIGGCRACLDPKPRFGMGGELVAPGRLTGLGTAELDDMATGRGTAEIVIETHHPMHLGPREVQYVGNDRQSALVDIAKLRLKRLKDRHQRAIKMLHILRRSADQIQINLGGWFGFSR